MSPSLPGKTKICYLCNERLLASGGGGVRPQTACTGALPLDWTPLGTPYIPQMSAIPPNIGCPDKSLQPYKFAA